MERLFGNIYRYLEHHKKTYWVLLLVTILLCAWGASRVSFEEDISKMMSLDNETKELSRLLQNSKSTDKIVLSISSKTGDADPYELMAVADTLSATIKAQCSEWLDEVRVQINSDDIINTYSIITQNFPVFVSEKAYQETIRQAFEPKRLETTIDGYIRVLNTPGGTFARQALVNDPAGLTLPLFEQLKDLQSSTQFTTIDNYLFSKDEKSLIILLYSKYSANETGHNSRLINALEEITSGFAQSDTWKTYDIEYFGGITVSVGNAKQVQKDTYTTLIFAGIVLLILLLSVFQKKRLPLLILATVLFGLLFSLAMIGLFKSTISLIAIGTGAVILGVAVNYPIHFFTHYLHNKNVEHTIKSMVEPMTIGSLTTIGGFLCLTLTNSELLKDFGLFGAFCLMGAVIFSLIFLPHLAGKVKETRKTNFIKRALEWISVYPLDRKLFFPILILVLTPILLYFSFQVEYEEDLDQLNYMSAETRATEKRFMSMLENGQNLFLITKGNTVEEALGHSYSVMLLSDSLRQTGIDCYFAGVVRVIPPKQVQQTRVDQWNKFWKNEPMAKHKAIVTVFDEKGLDTVAFTSFFNTLNGHQKVLPNEDYQYLLDTFGSEFLYQSDSLCTIVSQIKVAQEYRETFAKHILSDPNTVILDKRAIASNVVNSVSDNFNRITWWTSILVFLAILISYGRIELTLITFCPMVISWIWILGFMALFDIKFNIVNIILSTFIFGLGDDFCIFTTDGNLKEYTRKENHTSVIRMSVLISGITSLIGLGALMFAKHPAIHSLGAVSVLGILSVLFISQTLQPLLFRIFISRPTQKKHAPISLLTIILSIFTFFYFIFVSLFAGILGIILKIVPIGKQRKKYFLHWLKYIAMRGLVYGSFVIKKVKINTPNETFDKPAIIIANHQSMLDILYILCLHPKIVIVVKRWVWNSPVMGLFVRMAGFHAIEDGTENNLTSYQKTLDEGYSIAVFPEGSRSDGTRINRFHKGAFFLAEKLQADLIPLVIQHNYETLPKGTFSVYPHQMTMRIYDRISPTNNMYGNDYRERTKNISKWYQSEYPHVGEENANNRYCLRKLKDAYMFHSPMLEWYLRIKVKLEQSYGIFEQIVPKQGHIVDAGCGYGFLTYVLAMRSSQRQLLGIDYDADKIVTAQNTYIRNEKTDFMCADITRYDFPQADCYILSDVLHYIAFEQTEQIMMQLSVKLNAGGTIIVRDADTKEHTFNKTVEYFSTRVFRFNKTQQHLNFFSSEALCNMMQNMDFSVEKIYDQKKAINTLLVFRKG